MKLSINNLAVLCLLVVIQGQSALVGLESSPKRGAEYPGHGSEGTAAPVETGREPSRYVILPDQSRFMAKVKSGGLLWFLGHTHQLAIRDFKGEAQFAGDDTSPASLVIDIKAQSLEETASNFTDAQKQIINTTMRKEVLQVNEYPDITFRSTDIRIEKKGAAEFTARVGGELALHGIVKPVVIPATIAVSGDTLEATGEFSVKRSDYGVKTHSIKWGTIRVRNKIRFTFKIVAHRA